VRRNRLRSNHDCSRCPIDLSEFRGRTMNIAVSRRRFLAVASVFGCGCLRRHIQCVREHRNKIALRTSSSLTATDSRTTSGTSASPPIWEPQWVPDFGRFFSRTASSARKPTWCKGQGRVDRHHADRFSIWAYRRTGVRHAGLGAMCSTAYAHMARALDGGVGASLAEILRSRTGCTIMGWDRISQRAACIPRRR